MMEIDACNRNIVEKNFFVIDTDNIKETDTSLYGFCIANNIEDICDEIGDNIKFSQAYSNGTYILIQNLDDKLYVSQDFNGNYGLYLFQRDGYFALSNSFLLLVEKVKSRFPLTLNYDYANALHVAGLSPIANEDTIVNEIEVLPRNVQVVIDKNTKKIEYKKINYKEHSIKLDSEEGIRILDQWFCKWIHLIRELDLQNKKLRVDISGGMDSRLVFMLFLKAGINLDKVRINSLNDGLHCHKEDFEIASEIAKYYGICLNQNMDNGVVYPLDLEECINVSFYTKLSIHKEMYWKTFYWEEPRYNFGGAGGEFLRALWHIEPEQFIKQQCNSGKRYAKTDVSESVEKIVNNSYNRTKDNLGIDNMQTGELTQLMYRDTRCRHHFGKLTVEEYCVNGFRMTPLMDSELAKLCSREYEDANLLITLIFNRYCPELLKFRFEGKREIARETIEYAEKINMKYPLKLELLQNNVKRKLLFEGDNSITSNDHTRINVADVDGFLYSFFQDKQCRELISTYFNDEICDYASDYKEKHNYFPLKEVYAILGTYTIADLIKESPNEKNTLFWKKVN